MEVAIVLMGNQHLGNVPFGDLAKLDELIAEALWQVGDCGHVATEPYPFRPWPHFPDLDLADAGLADAELAYLVRRSDRARRVRVTVDRGGNVEVVLPRRLPQRVAQEAVVELRPWIERRLAEVGRQRAAVLARVETVPYLGASLALVRVRQVAPESQDAARRWWYRMGRNGRRRSSAGTGGWRARRSARAWTEPARRRSSAYTRLTIRDSADPLGELFAQWGDELQLAGCCWPPRPCSIT